MESSEMEPLIQEASSGLANEHVDSNTSQLNNLTNEIHSDHSPDGDSAIDVYERHQSCFNLSISSDLITERIYHNIIKERNFSDGDTQADNELKYCNVPKNFAYQGIVSGGDFSVSRNVQKNYTREQNLFDNGKQQAEVPNGDVISQYSDYFSHDSTFEEDVGIDLEDYPKINLHQNGITSDDDNKSKKETVDQHSEQDSSSIIDRAYTCIMNRYSGFKHFNPDQFSDNIFGKRRTSFPWDEGDDDTPSNLTKSDSIRNLLEAMHSMGVKLDLPELQTVDSVAPDNSTTSDRNESLPEDVKEVNQTAEFKNQHFTNFEFNTDKPSIFEDLKNSETNQRIHRSIKNLLLQDLQTTGCLNEESAKALSTTVDEFSHWISKLVTENEILRKSMEEEKLNYKSENWRSKQSPQSVPHNLIKSGSTKTENLEERVIKENFKCFESIPHGFQTSKSEQAKSVIALKVGKFLESANKKVEQAIENKVELAQSHKNNRFDDDILNMRYASEDEIRELLKNDQSEHDLFNCEDSECRTKVIVHFSVSSNLNTLIIMKSTYDGQVKYLLIEISPNIKIKTTCRANEFNGDGSFSMHLMTSNYSFSISL